MNHYDKLFAEHGGQVEPKDEPNERLKHIKREAKKEGETYKDEKREHEEKDCY